MEDFLTRKGGYQTTGGPGFLAKTGCKNSKIEHGLGMQPTGKVPVPFYFNFR